MDGAENGRHALELAAQDPPALAIVDLGLPDLSGWHVIDTLRCRDVTSDVPLVTLSIQDPPASLSLPSGAVAA